MSLVVSEPALAGRLALARELARPVSIHVRSDDESAYDDLLAIWIAEGGRALEGVLHCYTGSLAFARRALDEGFSVSFSGIVIVCSCCGAQQPTQEGCRTSLFTSKSTGATKHHGTPR